ncbi:ParB/RepB/Spo0J family partition protein [Neptuniibacter sp. QD37_11]|uniref:ParB/RepB/Spo0J family partition protein n=1 Tax=Neptuniibacter sp. QD37_11 TaxID=3398209 RepID=UPI0039F474B4
MGNSMDKARAAALTKVAEGQKQQTKVEEKTEKLKEQEEFSKSYQRLPISNIFSNPQIRKEFSDIDEIAASLLSRGQLQAIIVYRDGSRYIIQVGERRWRGAKLLVEQGHAEWKYIDCKVIDKPKTEKDKLDSLLDQITENIQRDELTPEEIYGSYKEIQKVAGVEYTLSELAQLTGKKKEYVRRYMSIGNIPENLWNKIKGFVKDADAIYYFSLLCELDPKEASLMAIIASSSEELTRKTVKSKYEPLLRKKEQKEKDPYANPENWEGFDPSDEDRAPTLVPPPKKKKELKKKVVPTCIYATVCGKVTQGIISEKISEEPNTVFLDVFDTEYEGGAQPLLVKLEDLRAVDVTYTEYKL